MSKASDPPSDACLTCDAWRGWRSAAKWTVILVPIAATLLLAAGGGAATSLVRDANTRSDVETLEERRIEAAGQRSKLAAEQRAAEREYAHHRQEEADRWRDIAAALARIEARLDGLERPTGRRRTR